MRASGATAQPLAGARPNAFALRLASAALLAPLAIAAVWAGSPYFTILVTLAAGIMGWEWGRLTFGPGNRAARLTLIGTEIVAVALGGFALWMGALLGLAIGSAVVTALALRDLRARAAWAALGIVWIGGGSIAALWLRTIPNAGAITVLWLFALVWASDSGAYVVGKGVGGPLLAPRVSPGKTWSGAVGGLAAAALVGAVAEKLMGLPLLSGVLWTSVTLSVVGQAGDLVESLAKRHFGVKDASGLIPGHGGFLDRLDAMLAVLVVVAGVSLATRTPPLNWP
ncbi:MAG TPA: phosphatidate cytidylyltransferase [Stellaceae bacterium]|nr:phosphatidate cytidylyltransferase [Stellaceae bacterium]